MNMKSITKATAVAATALFMGVSGSAQAATVTLEDVVDLNTVNAAASTTLGSNVNLALSNLDDNNIVTGSSSGNWRSPFDGSGAGETAHVNEPQIDFFSVGPSTTSPGVLVLNSAVSAIKFLIGSVDDYNSIEFYLNNVLVDTVLGADIILEGAEEQVGATWITISNILGGSFDRIDFVSGQQNALEFSNFSVVPVPPAILLFGSGVLGLGFLARNRKSKASVSA